MKSLGKKEPCTQNTVYVSSDKDHVCCPQKSENVSFAHPRVFLTIKPDKPAICPYCSTLYQPADQYE